MRRSRLYLKLNYLSVLGIFVLFALGGLVRASGSGMGCPDWPKCFGSYIPPSSEHELPADYQEIFLSNRLKKAERFAALLTRLGFEAKAKEILAYDRLSEAHPFSASKAYTEYINRLWGALTGLFVLGAFIAAIPLLRSHTKVFLLTLGGFVLVMANALLGAVVVHANLLGGMVTSHFLLAFAAMALFLWARYSYAPPTAVIVNGGTQYTIWALMALVVVQLVAGTQVRESYDLIDLGSGGMDSAIIAALGKPFHLHRTLAIVSLLLAFLQYRRMVQESIQSRLKKMATWMIVLMVAQIAFGSMIVMTDLSGISKFLHITVGASIFTLQFYICRLTLNPAQTQTTIENA